MVDIVIAFVNNRDDIWRNAFIKYCREHNLRQFISKLENERYSGVNWLPYQLKLINKNMPFINKIFLLLSNKEQVNGIELPSNVEIVLHKDFIEPSKLPTFNSTTIEMYLPNIKGLGEKFIYANDDMLPVGKLNESDFFDNDKIKINWHTELFDIGSNVFKYQCFNSHNLIRDIMKKPKNNYFVRPYHSMTPMIKSHCRECFNATHDKIKRYASAFRNGYNYNQYIYPIYEYEKYGTLPTNIDFEYTEFKNKVDINHQIVCVNVERNKEYVDLFIKELEKLCE